MGKVAKGRCAGLQAQTTSAFIEVTMQGIFPSAPRFSSTDTDARPVCEWIRPALLPERDYARTRRALPSGMPGSLEVHVLHFMDGVERSTVVMYGARAYLVHYEFRRHGDPVRRPDAFP